MNLFADFHTHTRYSHGTGTVRDNVDSARKKGLSSVAITDHGPGNLFGIGVKSADTLLEILAECRRIEAEYGDITVLAGVEANIAGRRGKLDVPDEVLARLDIVLVGYHRLVRPGDLPFAVDLIRNYRSGGDIAANTDLMVEAVCRHRVDVVTHPGLSLAIDTRVLAEACAANNCALEINSSHDNLTVDFVEKAAEAGAYFVINSDAHRPEDVGSFGKGILLAGRAGLGEDRIINARVKTLEGGGSSGIRHRDRYVGSRKNPGS